MIEINTQKNQSLSFEYSEDKEKLQEILKDVSICIDNLRTAKFLDDDKEERDIVSVIISRGPENIATKKRPISIEFNFGCSIADTIKNRGKGNLPKLRFYDSKDMLYSILCCCNMDFCCPNDLDEFMSDYGYEYNNQTKMTFYKCQIQAEKLHKIFSEDEIQFFPS